MLVREPDGDPLRADQVHVDFSMSPLALPEWVLFT